MNIEKIKLGAKIELARRDFFYFCHLKAPDFYKHDRKYLIDLCGEMQSFIESDEEILIVNLPPRMGKSRSACYLVEWLLGKDKTKKIMTGSYNETLSTVFSKNVRNDIQEEKADEYIITYSDIFPDTRIKKGDGAMNLWSLDGGYNNYLATSPSGTATGFGANILLIDDLIKNAEEAFNESVLEKHWEWFCNTMLSRLEENGKIIIIMTRWASRDLAGRSIEFFKNRKLRLVIKKALQDDGSMLCDEVLSKKSYENKIRAMGEEIASANYQQIPIDSKGALYQNLKTYTDIPKNNNGDQLFDSIKAYCDTADTGEDYLCNIIYGIYQKQCYVLDVYYTKDPMEITEEQLAHRLSINGVNVADIESNNGGRGFARNVQRILFEKFKSCKTVINWFHQTKNKKSRILSASAWVQQNIYFPINWRDKYPEFYSAIISYQKEGKNKNDDAPDCLSGIYDKINESDAIIF